MQSKSGSCDVCGKDVNYRDPYGQVGLIICGAHNGGLAIAGPGGSAQQADGSWPEPPADPFDTGDRDLDEIPCETKTAAEKAFMPDIFCLIILPLLSTGLIA